MKKLLEKFSNSMVTAILTFAATIIAFLASMFCLFNGHMDIPLGFLLGGVVSGGLSLLSALAEKLDDNKQGTVFSVVVIILRMILLVGITLLLAFMTYRWNLNYFNIFAFVGMYTVSIIIIVIVYLISKK